MSERIIFLLLAFSLFSSPPHTPDARSDFAIDSLTLEKAEKIALKHNKKMRIAKEQTLGSNERKGQAISRFFPKIGYRAEVRDIEKKELFYNVFSNSNFPLNHQGYSSVFELSQPIFSTDLIFGLKSSFLESKAFLLQQTQTKIALLKEVRTRFYHVVFFENSLKIQRENIQYLAYALEQEQGRLNAGSATPFEVNESKAALSNAISQYYATLKNLKFARNTLIIALGIEPCLEAKMQLFPPKIPLKTIPLLQEKLLELEEKYRYSSRSIPSTKEYLDQILLLEDVKELTLFSSKDVEKYLESAFRLRPDLLAQKIDVGISQENVREKIGSYFPKISSYARYSYNDIDLGPKPFFEQDYHWSVGLVLSWNLFDSMLREHEVREAKALKSSTKISYEFLREKIEVEIRNGLYDLEEALLVYASSSQAVFVALQAAMQAKEKLEFGRIAPLEYRDAVNRLFEAQNRENLSIFTLLAAYFEIRYATGIDTK